VSETAGIPVVAAPVRAHAVCFTGDNLNEVRAVVSSCLHGSPEPPDGFGFAVGWPETSNPAAIKLWDPRSERWAYAMPGDWIIVVDGVLVLNQWWFRTLFNGHAAAPDRLSQAAELAAQLQQLLAVQEEPAPPRDPLSPVNLVQVPPHHTVPPMPIPVVGDVWRDESGKTWTVRRVPEQWWEAECVDGDGYQWTWQMLHRHYSPLVLDHRTSVFTAA